MFTKKPATATITPEPIAIRRAGADDQAVLARLAALDSARRVPSGDVLIADVGDQPRAAIELATGATVADPFAPSAQVVAILRIASRNERKAA